MCKIYNFLPFSDWCYLRRAIGCRQGCCSPTNKQSPHLRQYEADAIFSCSSIQKDTSDRWWKRVCKLSERKNQSHPAYCQGLVGRRPSSDDLQECWTEEWYLTTKNRFICRLPVLSLSSYVKRSLLAIPASWHAKKDSWDLTALQWRDPGE
jgi:hypothetical protein